MTGILCALNTPNSLQYKLGRWILDLGEGVVGEAEAEAEPLHVKGVEMEIMMFSRVVNDIFYYNSCYRFGRNGF